MFTEWRRIILYVVTAVLGSLLVILWGKDHQHVSSTANTSEQTNPSNVENNYNPQNYLTSTSASPKSTPSNIQSAQSAASTGGQLIQVRTDLLDLAIDSNDGNLVSAKLLKYPVSLDEPHVPMSILSNDPQQLYLAQSGILAEENQGQLPAVVHYQADKENYQLTNDAKSLTVKLIGTTSAGVVLEKDYVFKRNNYAIDVSYQVRNQSSLPWKGAIYQQITRGGFVVKSSLHGRSYTGPSISSPETPYEKVSFKKLAKNNLSRDIDGGWLAMQQQYFLSAWIPNQNQVNHFYSHVTTTPNSSNYADNIYTIGYLTPYFTVNPHQSINYQSKFYVGPEITKYLQPLAKGLDRTIDYGYLWFISKFIFWLMQHIHNVVGNWGWSIVIITLLVRLSLYWFAARGFHSMAKMRDIQPRIQSLKERIGDDRQALSKATMELYRKEKINPMGGCLPMIIQIPVFFALYYVLIESVELRQAPFILWVHDLSVHDPYYVLPILMGLSMLLQQKLSPPPPDPTQAKMMMLLPVIFTVFFLSFPAGLVLYWLTNNCASVAQQWYIIRSYDPKAEREKARKKKKMTQIKKI